MSKPVITIEEFEPVNSAVKLMAKNNIGCLTIQKDSKPIGIITERDIIRALGKNQDLKSLTVKNIMSTNVKTVGVDATLLDITKLMNKNYFRRVIVVDDSGNIAGIITAQDLIMLVSA